MGKRVEFDSYIHHFDSYILSFWLYSDSYIDPFDSYMEAGGWDGRSLTVSLISPAGIISHHQIIGYIAYKNNSFLNLPNVSN